MLNSIKYKIEAIILAITLFFVGVIYADQPIEVEFDCELSTYEISAGDPIYVKINCKNVGRPFEGEHNHANASISFYKIKNGSKEYLSASYIVTDEDSQPILVKKSEEFTCGISMQFDLDAEPGIYSALVRVYGCEKIYEDVLTIK